MRMWRYFLFFLIVSCSYSNYSVHENNLRVNNKIMIKNDKKMKKKMIKARKLATPRNARIKTSRVKRIIS
jgi:hypothetical protein